jgi:opacity protein-like surface antigen
MRSVMSVVFAGTVAFFTTTAFAADVPISAPPPYGYPPPPPGYAPPPPAAYAPPPPVVGGEEFAGWYLRGDVGITQQRVKSLFNVLYETPGISVSTPHASFSGASLFGVGVGYQFGNWFRADVTGEYRAKASFSGLDIVNFNGVPVGTDEYRAFKEEWLALVNLYADLGTWWCITPFIGVGIGGAKITVSSFTDVGTITPGGGPSVAFAKDESKFNFAYALHAGLGYKVSNSLTMELAYRYVHLGDALSGDIRTFNGINNVNNPMHFNGITSHDVKLGVRWTCCEPVAPVPQPVLMRRG